MSRVFQGVAALACLADAGSPPNYEIMWNEFKNTYDKNYNDLDEPLRFATFKENVDYIYETNAKSLSFTLGVTEFADMTNEDFKATYMGYKKPVNTWAELPHLGTHTYSGEELAEAVDWVAKGAVTKVKNQGHCGSCWSFSTTGALEGAWQLATGKLVPLSEQELVDCDQRDHACHGGVFEYGFMFAQANGLCSEASYPYTATKGACQSRCEVGIPRGGVVGFKDVTRGSMEAVMSALSKQPVSIAIEADQRAFQLYRGGVLSDGCGTQLDHAVLLVGYGTDGGKDYWKVKNSWGPGWGESGYIRLLKGKGGGGECGLLMQPSYPVVKGAEVAGKGDEPVAVQVKDACGAGWPCPPGCQCDGTGGQWPCPPGCAHNPKQDVVATGDCQFSVPEKFKTEVTVYDTDATCCASLKEKSKHLPKCAIGKKVQVSTGGGQCSGDACDLGTQKGVKDVKMYGVSSGCCEDIKTKGKARKPCQLKPVYCTAGILTGAEWELLVPGNSTEDIVV